MSRKHGKICATLNYIEYLIILASTVTRCVSISIFLFFSWYSCRYCKLWLGLKNYVITTWTKKYKSMIKKNRKKAS